MSNTAQDTRWHRIRDAKDNDALYDAFLENENDRRDEEQTVRADWAERTVENLDKLGTDTEIAHNEADKLILDFLQKTYPEIAQGFYRVDTRCGGFLYA
jgi:hypothetical protein